MLEGAAIGILAWELTAGILALVLADAAILVEIGLRVGSSGLLVDVSLPAVLGAYALGIPVELGRSALQRVAPAG